MRRLVASLLAAVATLAGSGCGNRCGPESGVVEQVLDGDTIVLDSGEKVRYLMVDAPETSGTPECYGPEARDFNRQLVVGREVTLRYDAQCTDAYDRLLAWVSVDGNEVNTTLVQRGYACVLHIPPNGDDRAAEFEALEDAARQQSRGLWASCPTRPC